MRVSEHRKRYTKVRLAGMQAGRVSLTRKAALRLYGGESMKIPPLGSKKLAIKHKSVKRILNTRIAKASAIGESIGGGAKPQLIQSAMQASHRVSKARKIFKSVDRQLKRKSMQRKVAAHYANNTAQRIHD